jgi:hypothetical protein
MVFVDKAMDAIIRASASVGSQGEGAKPVADVCGSVCLRVLKGKSIKVGWSEKICSKMLSF